MGAQLKNLMQGLYYPAVTGTGVVLVLYRVTMHDSPQTALHDYALGYGILFVLFFSASFMAISLVPKEQYSGWEFALDVMEVIFAFLAFYYLGLFDTGTLRVPNLKSVYGSVALLGLTTALWRLFLRDGFGWSLWILRLSAVSIALAGYFLLHQIPWFNATALLLNYVLVLRYLNTIGTRDFHA